MCTTPKPRPLPASRSSVAVSNGSSPRKQGTFARALFLFSSSRVVGLSMKLNHKAVEKSFKATLERMQSNLGWVIVRIPFDVSKVWGVRGNLRVKGEINRFPFRTSLFPTGKGYHFLLVNKRMQAGADAAPGMAANFCLAPDTGEREAILPSELKRILSQDRSLRRWFDNLSYSIRR